MFAKYGKISSEYVLVLFEEDITVFNTFLQKIIIWIIFSTMQNRSTLEDECDFMLLLSIMIYV